MSIRFCLYSAIGTLCFEPDSLESLVPSKMVMAAMSVTISLVTSLGKIILFHLVLYPENPLLMTSHFLQEAKQSSFFQNEEIFVQLDELDELDRIPHA